ncbi:uncharacterized protein LOC134233343 [Saccostrea cucullata]|uniref:uncharacterized protein LOC134233343 n=1 Tax=Saccostrea cuccullata TaxID=36930 RepID=UPI002ED54B8C
MASHYHTVKPQFSENHGDNIALEKDGAQNCFKAEWKFLKSYGYAFSDFPLPEDRMYEAIFHGSGHASIGLTQTDPNHLSDLQQAVKNGQIVLVTDVRFHKRDCTVDIVKKTDSRKMFVFQTKYRESAPQGKSLMPGADVWIVFYLKFGGENMIAEIRDKETRAALRFHRKVDRNIDLQNERLKVSLRSPIPLAYAVLENSLEKRHSVRVKTGHIDDKDKPRLYHIKIGISNSDANSSNSLEFCPNIETKLEKEDCIGEFYVCLSPKGTFHVHKDNRCIFTKMICSEVDINSPVYVWFEIFRIRLEAIETMYCTHDSEAIENPRESVRGITPPYAKVTVNELVRTLKGIDQELEAGKFTVEVQQTLTEATNEVEKYVNFFSLGSSKADKEVYDEKDGYLTPVSKTKSSSSSARLPIEHEDESPDQPSLRTLQRMLIQIEKTAKAHHFERQTSLDQLMIAVETNRTKIEEVQKSFENVSIQKPSPTRIEPGTFQTHLLKTCAQFIQTVEVFPLCDHLLQEDIIHQEQYNNIFDEHRRQRIDASRTLFHHLSKKPYSTKNIEKITQAFIDTKQEYLLPGWQ